MAREDGALRFADRRFSGWRRRQARRQRMRSREQSQMIRTSEVKKKAVFRVEQMPKEEGVPKLIEVAEKNKNPEVRKRRGSGWGSREIRGRWNFF